MRKKNILLLCGGGGAEHEISLESAQFFLKTLQTFNDCHTIPVELCKDGAMRSLHGEITFQLNSRGELSSEGKKEKIDFAIPCIHGPPGETGHIQGACELMKIPYLGAGPEASLLAFNKISTKLWMDSLGIPNTPYTFCHQSQGPKEILKSAYQAFEKWPQFYIKASSQGSSMGCYKIVEKKQIAQSVTEALALSPYLLFEKSIVGRELEIAVFEYNHSIVVTRPGEILCPTQFYSYEEKYNQTSHTQTEIIAKDIQYDALKAMQKSAELLFSALGVNHLARVDFFYTEDHQFFLNEINTFPGMTSISMFPKMLQAHGISFKLFLDGIINRP